MRFRTALRIGGAVVATWFLARRTRKAARQAVQRGARRLREAVA